MYYNDKNLTFSSVKFAKFQANLWRILYQVSCYFKARGRVNIPEKYFFFKLTERKMKVKKVEMAKTKVVSFRLIRTFSRFSEDCGNDQKWHFVDISATFPVKIFLPSKETCYVEFYMNILKALKFLHLNF